MRKWWSRTSAIAGLLAALASALWQRALWVYRSGHRTVHTPPPTIVARRPSEVSVYLPTITDEWKAVAARALPVCTAREARQVGEELLPVIWVDTTDRPDIEDLPRVLEAEGRVAGKNIMMAAQWLADPLHPRVVLVATYIEPVSTTWAVSFELPRLEVVLQRIADVGELFIAWGPRPEDDQVRPLPELPGHGLLLDRIRPSQLQALLAHWEKGWSFAGAGEPPLG